MVNVLASNVVEAVQATTAQVDALNNNLVLSLVPKTVAHDCSAADLIRALSTFAWPLVVLCFLLLLWFRRAPPALDGLAGVIGTALQRGFKLVAGPITVETVPAEVATEPNRAVTREANPQAALAGASHDLIARLKAAELEGPVGTYPYLLHAAVQQRPRTTLKSGLYSVRIWLEFDDLPGHFDAKQIRRVIYRLDDTWPEVSRVVATAAADNGYELWISTYGEFTVIAVAETMEGKEIWLTRYLDLPGRPPD